MGLTILDAGEGGRVVATLRDADRSDPDNPKGVPIPLSDISTATCTLRDAASGEIINSRDGQNVKNANNCAIDSTSGGFRWDVQAGDSTPFDSTADIEWHDALFTFTGSFVGSPLEHTHTLMCVNFLLCRFEDVQMQLTGQDGTPPSDANEAIVTLMIAAFGDAVRARSGRTLKKSTTANPTTQVFSPDGRSASVRLTAYPVDEIVSVKEAWDGDFDSADDIKADCVMTTPYTLRHRFREFIAGPGSLQVKYAGGIAKVTSGVPGRLRLAAAQQVAKWWQDKDRLGITSISVAGGSIQTLSQLPLLPWVQDQVEALRPAVGF